MTNDADTTFVAGEQVRSMRHGIGSVVFDNGGTVIVRYSHGVEECLKTDLEQLGSLDEKLAKVEWDVPLEVLNRLQAEAIESVNSVWGVFSRSRMELLPHQLWVCRTVNAQWPARWLVADDVGLGKTVEAGMILWPLLARNVVRRLLVLCPASLVDQWQYRLRTMFDIRLTKYLPDADTARSDFWNTHDRVVASLHTLRLDQNNRHNRLVAAEPWDLVFVDEAHHLNADENRNTLGYALVKRLVDEHRVNSMVFFTGTPHRGKEHGFVALLALLRPDLFDPRRPAAEQMSALPDVMIRNNKASVTDLHGNRLFQKPSVRSETYRYSEEEERFYELLTAFIASGRAYASGLNQVQGQAVMLVLISMQKLASSSVAAIRRAIRNRLARIETSLGRLEDLSALYARLLEEGSDDEISSLEEKLAEVSTSLQLMENERPALEELLRAAEAVGAETKIDTILALLEGSFAGQTILFFTEYKATQSLLLSALFERFGQESATFINGDDLLDSVRLPDGSELRIISKREEAARRFNDGKVRFLISTEAGGEGIDLQERCHTLIHVDLPWNPMRLHQRVGRLNRYGQTQRVEVLTLRNPDTVESLIWDHLNTKLERISRALGAVMDEPEDLLQLVLGMTSRSLFDDLFSGVAAVPRESLGRWFDEKTSTFGGNDVVQAVRDLVGNVSKFDFGQVSASLPRVDLDDLRPFLETALTLGGRKLRESERGVAFHTPEEWKVDPAVRDEYLDMTFDRTDRSADALSRLLGVGHKAIDRALRQSLDRSATVASLPADTHAAPLVVFRVRDRVTGDVASTRSVIIVAEQMSEGGGFLILRDWELLRRINDLPFRKVAMGRSSRRPAEPSVLLSAVASARAHVDVSLSDIDHGFRYPSVEPLAVLWPSK